MVDAPYRRDAPLLALTVREQEVRQAVEAKGNVLQAAGGGVLGLRIWEVNEGDTVVLLVVRDEGDHVVAICDTAAEERGVKVLHCFQICCP